MQTDVLDANCCSGCKLMLRMHQFAPDAENAKQSFCWCKARALDSHWALCTCLAPNVMPLNWKTPLPSPRVHTHLPVDALAHLTVSLLKDFSFVALINSTILPNLPFLPSDEIMTRVYCALKPQAETLMMDKWLSLSLLNYYPYPLCLSPHPSVGLGKFMAGHILTTLCIGSYKG